MRIKNNSIKGSTTVEAALIFPLIFIGLILIFYMGILQFQNISSVAASMDAANYISSNWRYLDPDSEKPKNAEDIIKKEYYAERHIWDVYGDVMGHFVDSDSKMEAAQQILMDKTGVVPKYFTKDEQAPVMVDRKLNSFLVNTIEVKIDKTYFNPLMRYTRIGLISTEEEYKYNAKVVSTITNPTDFIRNLDFILFMVNEGQSDGE